jgi:hypothetical protein
MSRPEVVVTCQPTGEGWLCIVAVGDDPGRTEHVVSVDTATLADLAPGAEPESLVAESVAFLLEREPRDSILRRFELPVIGRYFPEFRDEIRRRLAG